MKQKSIAKAILHGAACNGGTERLPINILYCCFTVYAMKSLWLIPHFMGFGQWRLAWQCISNLVFVRIFGDVLSKDCEFMLAMIKLKYVKKNAIFRPI